MFVQKLKTTATELWRDGRGWILLTIAAGWFLSLGIRLVFPALVPFFRTDFQLSLTMAGLLLSVLWGAYALGQLPGGILGDYLGEGRILVYSTLLSSVALLLVVLSIDIRMLFVGTVLFGLATALYGPTRFTVFTDIYSDRAGSAIGLTMAAGSAGNTILPIVAVAIAVLASWRWGLGFTIPLLTVVALSLWVVVPKRTSGEESIIDDLSIRTLKRVFRKLMGGNIPIVSTIQTAETFVFQGFVSFFPTYLIISKGLSPTIAAMLYALFFASAFVIQPAAGMGNDRFGPKKTLLVILGVSATAMWMLPFTDSLVLLVLLTVLTSTLSGTAVVTQTYLADSLPKDMKGTGLGMIRTIFILLGATSPVIIGLLGDAGYFNSAFLLLAAFLSIGAILTFSRL